MMKKVTYKEEMCKNHEAFRGTYNMITIVVVGTNKKLLKVCGV